MVSPVCPRAGLRPRGRGDDHGLNGGTDYRGELPPQARGRPQGVGRSRLPDGATPAGAGTTSNPRWRSSGPADHPRRRGDDAFGAPKLTPAKGPPPQARGRHSQDVAGLQSRGTTPAGAGTTRPRATRTSRTTDHPRVRGDDSSVRCAICALIGPLPCVRGRFEAKGWTSLKSGTTPACAGTIERSTARRPPPADHPRVCGDDYVRSRAPGLMGGPPPRVRGRSSGQLLRHLVGGTTPACAGTMIHRRR